MPKRRSKENIWDKAQNAASRLHERDQIALVQAEQERTQKAVLSLTQIQNRTTNTRQLRDAHVKQLAESIAELGLIEPLVVDNRGCLLAGGHRKAAIEYLKQHKFDIYQKYFYDDLIPVRMMGFSAEGNPELALQIEISENEKRRDYTPSEVRALAERLRKAGYVDSPGRPKKGEKRLRPALEIIIGKSLRSVRRYLTEEKPVHNGQVSGSSKEKPVHNGQVSSKLLLKQAKEALAQWKDLPERFKNTQANKKLDRALPDLLNLIEEIIIE